jgi:hypothetical protein
MKANSEAEGIDLSLQFGIISTPGRGGLSKSRPHVEPGSSTAPQPWTAAPQHREAGRPSPSRRSWRNVDVLVRRKVHLRRLVEEDEVRDRSRALHEPLMQRQVCDEVKADTVLAAPDAAHRHCAVERVCDERELLDVVSHRRCQVLQAESPRCKKVGRHSALVRRKISHEKARDAVLTLFLLALAHRVENVL